MDTEQIYRHFIYKTPSMSLKRKLKSHMDMDSYNFFSSVASPLLTSICSVASPVVPTIKLIILMLFLIYNFLINNAWHTKIYGLQETPY